MYDNKKLKKLEIIDENKKDKIQCNSNYHKKLVDGNKS
jgi:hypothetical protein